MNRLTSSCGILFLLLSLMLSGCSKGDDYTYPSVKKEMVTAVYTVGEGLSGITTDDGMRHAVHSCSVKTAHKDSTARIICHYESIGGPADSGPVNVYSVLPVYSDRPVLSDDVIELWEDDIAIQSVWKGKKFVNMALEVLSTGKPHGFRFVDFDHKLLQDGSLRVDILLDHDMRENKEGYTQIIYASLPVEEYFVFTNKLRIRLFASLWEGEPYEIEFEK